MKRGILLIILFLISMSFVYAQELNCTDFDNGDYYTKGVIIDSQGNTFEDYCTSNNGLREYYCTPSGNINYIDHTGPDCVCANGACVNYSNYICEDSDDGLNYYIKGTVTKTYPNAQVSYSSSDYCDYRPLMGKAILREYSCIEKDTKEFECPERYYCENGACLQNTTEPESQQTSITPATPTLTEEIPTNIMPTTSTPNSPAPVQQTITPTSSQPESTVTQPLENSCDGCLSEKNCLPIGTRSNKQYCDISKQLISQKELESQCENNYECLSNECKDGKCVSTYGLLEKITMWLKSLFGFK
ncbi:MAG: hypothetical protein WC413_01100 [Candidatus Nanoarchaeia archaeon]